MTDREQEAAKAAEEALIQEAAAYRMGQGMTARGSNRRREPVPAVPVLPTEPEEKR